MEFSENLFLNLPYNLTILHAPMTNNEIRIAIAESLGFLPDDDGDGRNTWEASWAGKSLFCKKPVRDSDGKVTSYLCDQKVPNWPEDLNACHEIEKAVTDAQFPQYRHHLCEGTSYASFSERVVICATAPQRCEAYLRTLGLWKP